MYEGYLRQYGENGHFAFIAHQRIVSLSAPAPGIPLSVATPEPASAGPASRDTGCQQLVAHDPDLIDAKAAVPACEAELRQHPGNATALYGLGRAQTAAKNYIEANRLLDAAIKGGNTQSLLYIGRGLLSWPWHSHRATREPTSFSSRAPTMVTRSPWLISEPCTTTATS